MGFFEDDIVNETRKHLGNLIYYGTSSYSK